MGDRTGKMQELGELYGSELFYSWQVDQSYRSACCFSEHLLSAYQPASLADVGCGRGAWLKAFHERGVTKVVGVDGPWNRQELMIEPAIEFRGADLNDPAKVLGGDTFDMAMSLEVFEHLEPANATRLADCFTSLAPVLMFGAAFPHQGGQNHINERPHSYWAAMFVERGFEVFDYFRPKFWGNETVSYYYQQNTYLYVKVGHPLGQKLREMGYAPIENLAWLDAVHPTMLYRYVALTIPRRLRMAWANHAPAPLRWLGAGARRLLGIKPIRGPEGSATVPVEI